MPRVHPERHFFFNHQVTFSVSDQNSSGSLRQAPADHQTRLGPYSRDDHITESASAASEIIDRNDETSAFYEWFAAVVTIGIVSFMVWHIPQINIPYSFQHCQFSESYQG